MNSLEKQRLAYQRRMDGLTLDDIAKEMGLSRERVRQLSCKYVRYRLFGFQRPYTPEQHEQVLAVFKPRISKDD